MVVADAEDVPSSILEISWVNYFAGGGGWEKMNVTSLARRPFETQANNNNYIIDFLRQLVRPKFKLLRDHM